MAENNKSFDDRIKENIKNYDITQLCDISVIKEHMKNLAELCGINVLFTDRHGKEIFHIGDIDTDVDVETNKGRGIKVSNRTVAHLYVDQSGINEEQKTNVARLIDSCVILITTLADQTYRQKESSLYVGELETKILGAGAKRAHSEKIDPLTNVFNASYFKKRMEIIDRSEVAPVAVIEANINDWKYANTNFGDEGSDNLIRIVAEILKKEARPEYVIGRVDGDVFAVLIPMPEDGEAESYVNQIQSACDAYDDSCLTPSVACGVAYKSNVEEKLSDILSDADYLMFENKLEIKESAQYQARLHRAEA